MAVNGIAAEFFIDDRKATAAIDSFVAKMDAANAKMNGLGSGTSFARNFGTELERASQIQAKFYAAQADGGTHFKNLATQARNAAGGFKLAAHQAGQLSFQLNDIATMTAMGASPLQIITSQGGQIYQIFGSVNNMLDFTQAKLAAVGLSLGSLGLFAGVAAAGYAVVKWSESVLESAKKRLRTEEMIAGAMNRQLILGGQISENFAKQEKLQAEDRDFDKFKDGASIEQLQRRYDDLKRLQDIGGNTEVIVGEDGKVDAVKSEASKRRVAQMLALKAQIDKVRQDTTAADNKSFSDRNEAWKKSQADEIRFEQERAARRKEAAARFAADVKAGITKAEQYGKTVRDLFDNLAARAGERNPFVRVFADAAKAIDNVRENTKGLSKDLQAAAVAQQTFLNFRALQEARLNNRFASYDLRDDADKFRRPSLEDEQRAFNRRISDSSGQSTNPDVELNRLREATRLGLSYQPNLDRSLPQINEAIQNILDSTVTVEQERLRRRFDDQIDIAYRPGMSQEDKALADKKIIELTQGVNPNDLTGRQREIAAEAREREAVRLENYERDAARERTNQTTLQKQIAADISRLVTVAKTQGTKGVEARINIVDGTSNGLQVKQTSRPTPEDTAEIYRGDLSFLNEYGRP